MAYAFGRIEHEVWDARTWPVVEALLHQALMAEPSAAHKFVRALVRSESLGRHIDLDLLNATINRVILDHAPFGNASEVAWMLWAALIFRVSLTNESCAVVSRLTDSFVAILALDAQRRGLADGLDHSRWMSDMTLGGLEGDMWLLSYEARIRNWLPTDGGGNHLAGHPVFSYLESKNVRFYTRMRKVSRNTVRRLEETDAASYDTNDSFEDDDGDMDDLLDGNDEEGSESY